MEYPFEQLLPLDRIIDIFAYLTEIDAMSAALVNHAWRHFIMDGKYVCYLKMGQFFGSASAINAKNIMMQ